MSDPVTTREPMCMSVSVDVAIVLEFREAFADLTHQQARHAEQSRADAGRFTPMDAAAGAACARYARAASDLAKAAAGV